MTSDSGPIRRRSRTIARLLLLGGVALFLFSIFFYTSVFWAPGNGLAMHSGRISIIISTSNDPGRMPAGVTCIRTQPLVLFKPLLVTRGSAFIAVPLWIVGIPAAILLAADAWLIVRARRGRCFACGYSLAGLKAGTRCPECGHAPDLELQTPAQHLGAVAANLLRRTLTTLAALGVLVALVWLASGFYSLTFTPSARETLALMRGRFVRERTPPPWLRPAPRTSFVPAPNVSRWSAPVSSAPIPAPPPLPPLTWNCVPVDPIGWRFGSEFVSTQASGARSTIIPLWWIAPPLLACAIPRLRRRLTFSRPLTAPAPTVSSSGETR